MTSFAAREWLFGPTQPAPNLRSPMPCLTWRGLCECRARVRRIFRRWARGGMGASVQCYGAEMPPMMSSGTGYYTVEGFLGPCSLTACPDTWSVCVVTPVMNTVLDFGGV